MPGEADTERRVGILKQALKNPDYGLLVAELGEEIVGFIDQWVIRDFTTVKAQLHTKPLRRFST